jgi:hypothetical protein
VFNFGIPRGSDGAQGPAGPAGTSGIVYATSPLAYNSGTQTISIDLSAYATQSFVTSQGYITTSALAPYLLSSTAASTYYPLSNPANYITSSALSGYATQAWVDAQGYLQAGALTGYALQSWVTAGFYPLSSNPAGYLTSAALSGYATQSWVTSQGYLTSSALTPYATLASPTFTGDPKAPTPATADNDTSVATTAFVKAQGYITTANATANFYPLSSNPAGYVTSSTLSSALAVYALQNGFTAFSVTGASIKSFDGSDNFAALDQGALNFGNGSTPSGIVINGSSITFADATVQTTAATGGIPDAPSDGNTYGRNNGSWVIAGGGSGSGTLTYTSGQLYDTSTAFFVADLTLSGTLSAGTVTGGSNATLNSSGLTLAASSGAVITFADSTTQATAPHDIPSGGTTGQVLAKNSATDYDVSWVAAGGGGGGGHGVNIQTFGSSTTSGTFTWTKPTHAKWVEIYLVGGGGGGGSGARQATTSIRGGGGGGGGAPILYSRIGADALGSTETVVVGAGGVGAIAVATNSTNGNSASVATATTFANFRSGLGNPGGGGGSTTGGTAGGGGNGILFSAVTSSGSGAAGATGGASNASGTTGSFINPQGGGGGAGASASSTANASGGSGGPFSASTSAGNSASIAGGSAGTSAGVAATAGTNATTRLMQAGTGGGGGFYRTGVAGGTGGNGGWPGGGAGGGGASDNGFASGAGGNGGNGFALIITYT